MLLAVAVWLGALVFFPVLAATAFSALPTAHMAGLVVRGSLLKLHWVGFICGAAFLICSLMHNRVVHGRFRVVSFPNVLIMLMLLLSAISQFSVIPRMEALRVTAGEINGLAPTDSIRMQFESLHVWSTRIEGAVLLFGIVLLYSTSKLRTTMRP